MKKPAPVKKPPAEKIEGPFANDALLPPRVAAMREKILEACASGAIENLRPAIERNETMPLFGRAGDRAKNFATAIEFLRARSFDGKGRETLSLLEAVLAQPFVKVTRGVAVTYIWPAFAVIKSVEADAELRIAMSCCVAFADLAKIGAGFDAPFHRAEIGEDGTWHAFGVS